MNLSLQQLRPLFSYAGYDSADISESFRFTYITADESLRNRESVLVAFGGHPHSLRSALVAVMQCRPNETISDVLSQLRYLTTPIAFIADEQSIGLYRVLRQPDDTALVRADSIDALRGQLDESRLSLFERATLREAKESAEQLRIGDGLFTWAQQVTERSLTDLLEGLLTDAVESLPKSARKSVTAIDSMLRLVFHLFAGRVLEDKGVVPEAASAVESLRYAHERFSANINPKVLNATHVTNNLVSTVRQRLCNEFAFASLTTEMLGHAYENALVTPTIRKQRGIYYTPRKLTRYILSSLPIEALPTDSRILLDPCCGSGSFLVEGLERLRSLLPEDWSFDRTHRHLRKRILGRDIDDLACEIAALSLMLADVQARNGWDVQKVSVDALDRPSFASRPTIVVTNPPFRETKEGSRRERAAEVLSKCVDLLADDGFIGIILPLSFLDSRSSKDVRKRVLRECEILEIDVLAGGLFYSGADTAILMARKVRRRQGVALPTVTIRELRSRDVGRFDPPRGFSVTYAADSNRWLQTPECAYTLSPLASVWDAIASHATLGDVAELHSGLQVEKSDTTSIQLKPGGDRVRYIERLDVLRPFAVLVGKESHSTKWLTYGPGLRRMGSKHAFKSEKVLVNATRNPGSAWRLIAAAASADLYFSDHFHGIVPRADVCVEEIVAVLNSPIANAWFDAHCRSRKVVLSILRKLPWPASRLTEDAVKLTRQLAMAVKEKWRESREGLFYDSLVDPPDVDQLRHLVDQAVYEAYGLSGGQIAQIEKLMRLDRRPN